MTSTTFSARRHLAKDLFALALTVLLFAGFLAHASNPAPQAVETVTVVALR